MAHTDIELIIWTDNLQAPLAAQIISQLKDRVTILAIGGQRQADVTDLARHFDLPFDDDLRKLMVDYPPTGLLLLSMLNVEMDDLKAAHDAQTSVHTITPVTSTIAKANDITVRCQLLPRFDQCAGWTQAANPLESLGKLDQMHLTNLGKPNDGSLFARLVDSWELILSMKSIPTSVDAVISSSLPIPESLKKISGHLAIQARLSNGECVQMMLSDHAAVEQRQMTLLGQEAQLIVNDTQYKLYQPDGRIIDQWSGDSPMPNFSELISEGWFNAMTNPYAQAVDEALQVKRRKEALGCAHACLISARTGESETPSKVLELQV